MGEIGLSRREFLYEIQFWEARRIVKGYRRRGRLTHQLIAEAVYAATFAMRDPKGTTAKDMFPSLFSDDTQPNLPTEDEVIELQAEIDAMNKENEKKSE